MLILTYCSERAEITERTVWSYGRNYIKEISCHYWEYFKSWRLNSREEQNTVGEDEDFGGIIPVGIQMNHMELCCNNVDWDD